jgi:hypothetical protein
VSWLVPALIAGPFASYDQLLDHIDEHFSFTTDDGAVGRMSVDRSPIDPAHVTKLFAGGAAVSDALMGERGWSLEEFADWLVDSVERLLLR